MKEYIEFIARHLVDHPELVVLDNQVREDKVIFTLHVAEQDVGKVIGRKGRTAQAMRILLAAVAAREGKRVILEIAE
ncbi:MAG TPA: KH domain-containing protein [Bacteroidota bacterium]|nr:KH domain-containing protein [Bacteroidota bacterium]HTS00636.1 KH domain-containing protein [Bacteroidota bacterium]